jgi:BirA family biotin operon repressor/biotin-[acetyl-CoA-carboxylase] ligase
MDRLNQEIIKALLGKSVFAENIVIYKSLPSTNTAAKELFIKGAPHGTILITEEQTAGRGRMDRKWFSPPNKNILLSILLMPDIKAENVYALTLALAYPLLMP